MQNRIGAALIVAAFLGAVPAVPTVGALGAVAAAVAVAAVGQTVLRWPRARHRLALVTCAVAVISLGVSLAHSSQDGPAAGVAGTVETAALLALVVLTARYAPLHGALVAVTAAVAAEGVLLLRLAAPPSLAVAVWMCGFAALPAVSAAALGGYLRVLDSRRARSVAEARRAQRLAFARDLHDFVAHDVTGMVVRAQAALLVADRDPDQARAALERIAEVGTGALESLDRAVATLRAAGPAPDEDEDERIFGLADLPELVGRFRGDGRTQVALTLPPRSDEGVPAPVGATAYRVVTEALTNVRRHAPAATRVTVSIRRTTDSALVVTVTNTTAGRGAPTSDGGRRGGWGLTGLTERVEALGGIVHAGPHDDGWRVRATFPLGAR